MQKNDRLLMLLVAVLLVIVAIMVFAQYGEDGAVLFSGDIESTAILAIGGVAIAGIVGETVRNKNLTASFERLQSYMSNNPVMMNEVARRYQTLPPMKKHVVAVLVDIADAISELTPTDADDKLIDRLREALESKETSLEPTVGPNVVSK